jgi:sec-independent protein translocase protein TatC
MAQLIDTAPGDTSELEPASGSVLDEKVMSLAEHLGELRRRLVLSVVAIVIGSVIGWFLTPTALALLIAPLPGPLYFTSLGGAFIIQLKIALIIGLALASPLVLYQVWAFVAPGLTHDERRVVRPLAPLALLFLVLGFGVAYFILPFAAGFLLSFQVTGTLVPLLTAEQYFGFVSGLFIAFGLVMQFPFVLLLLSKVGLIRVEQLRRNRRLVLFGIAVFAVVITPGGDPFSPTMMVAVMYPLYELSIFLISRSSRGRAGR